MKRIIPSLASADQLHLADELERVSFLRELHMDIEDGNFLPNITFGMKTIRAVSQAWRGALDVHLLVTNPAIYLDDLADCGVAASSFQIETIPYPLELLHRIRSLGMKAGVALNPGTSLDSAAYLAPFADYFLLMCTEPDGRSQVFLPHMPGRIRACRSMLPPDRELWVDGGIGKTQVPLACQSGADVIIMGRAIFGSDDAKRFINKILEEFNEG